MYPDPVVYTALKIIPRILNEVWKPTDNQDNVTVFYTGNLDTEFCAKVKCSVCFQN